VIEVSLLTHAEAIEHLAAGVEGATRGRVEARQQQVLAERVEAEIAADAGRIAPGVAWAELVVAVPRPPTAWPWTPTSGRSPGWASGWQVTALGPKRWTRPRIRVRPPSRPRRIPRPARAVGRPAPGTRPGGPGAAARRPGPRDAGAQGAARPGAGGPGGALGGGPARVARPLLEAQIAEARKFLANQEQEDLRLADEDGRLVQDLAQQRLRQRRLAAAGEVVTAETLRLARGAGPGLGPDSPGLCGGRRRPRGAGAGLRPGAGPAGGLRGGAGRRGSAGRTCCGPTPNGRWATRSVPRVSMTWSGAGRRSPT